MKLNLFSIAIIVCLATLFIASCKSKSSSSSSDSTKSDSLKPHDGIPDSNGKQITLNGVDMQTALKRMKHFSDHMAADANPYPTSVWFSADQFTGMIDLLQSEINAQKQADRNRKDTTDGVRIYFASDPSVTSARLQTSILFISTYDSLTYPAGKSPHRNYYSHNSLLTAEIGNTSHDTNVRGANHFDPNFHCSADDDNCQEPTLHYVKCSDAYSWVQYNKNTPKPINTTAEWFDFPFLLKFSNAIKKLNLSGVRFYFARAHNSQEAAINEQSVLVLVPTEKDGNGVDVDYHKCIEDVAHAIAPVKIPARSFDYNNGELCPKNCN